MFILKFIRFIIGNSIVFINASFPPKRVSRQQKVQFMADEKAKNMTLYQFYLCPFCVKVRRMIYQMNVTIEMRDIKKQPAFEKELIEGGGKRKVPCLRIQLDGKDEWLYESSDINTYLKSQFQSI